MLFCSFFFNPLQPILVTVSVQQQKQITMLQTSMQDMAEDHVKSQEALIAWATDCIKGLTSQNERLEKIVNDQRLEINNVAYNLQGYENEKAALPEVPTFSVEAPGLYKTKTPKVIGDCAEMGEEEHGLFFHTATGAEVELSSIDFNPESRKGGPIKLIVPITEEAPPSNPKTQAQKDQARFKYQSAKGFNMPSGAKNRWQWAIKKVIRNNRLEKHRVGLNRGKLPQKETIAAKLAVMDHKLYEIPIDLRKHVAEREAAINARVDTEVETLNALLDTQKHEYTAMGEALQGNIDATNIKVEDIDKRLLKLQEQVDNGNKQLDEIELKLGKVIARVNTEETVLFDSIKARIQEANEKIASLKAGSGSVTSLMEKLNEMNEAMVEGIEYETDAERMDAEAKKLFEMLRFETEVRTARGEISLLDNNAFALYEALKFIRREILALSVLAGGDYEAIIPKETVNELLALVDSGLTTIDSVNEVITSANSLWVVHDTVLSHRWNVLAGVVEAVKNVSNIADDIVQLRETMATLPTEEKVKQLGGEIVTTALVPVNESIEEVDKKALKANDETNSRVVEVDEAWKAGIAQLDKDMRDTFDAIQVQRAEMGMGDGEGKPPSRAGNMDLETQLEPMIKDIVEMYVQHPPSRSKTDAAESKVSDFFSVQAVPEGLEDTEGGVQESPLFEASELSLVFNRTSEENAGEMSDEIQDNGPDSVDTRAGEGITVGCLVRVINKDSRFYDHSGIITAAVEDDVEEGGSAEEKEGETAQPENDDVAAVESEPMVDTAEIPTPATGSSKQRFRVAMTPKTPKNPEGGVELEGGFRTFDTYDGGEPGEGGVIGGRPGSTGAGMEEMRRQMAALSKKIEEIVKGFSDGSFMAGDEAGEGNVGGSGPASRSMSPSQGIGGKRSGTNSPLGIQTQHDGGGMGDSPMGSLRKSPAFGQSSAMGGAGPAGASQSLLDSGSVVDLIQDSLKHVSNEIGDLRQTSARELQKAKDAMKKAILTAINKAIQEEAEKDKPAMLSTKSLCVGCGRPSLVRAAPFDQDLLSKAFNPALNAHVQAGADIYRAGFRMPVNKNNSVAKLHGMVPGGAKVYGEESLFGGVGEEESAAGTLNTYSEILANLDHRDNKGQVTSLQDSGPAGMSISITSTTAPIRQLSYPARNIRHAQGKDDAAMLRPIHRKGFPGKTSEKARAGANKTWVPERFDDPSSLGLSPKAVSIPRPKLQQQLQQQQQPQTLTDQSVASSQFHP